MKIRTLLPLACVGLMVACAPSTQIVKSWSDPSFNAATMKPFQKVLVLAPLKDASSERIAEDKIVAQLRQGLGVQAYNYLKSTDTIQKVVEQKLVKDGFDGVIIMRLTDVQKSLSYNQGTTYGGWYGYRSYTPGYYSEDQTFMVVTDMYSLRDNKLLWSGTTSTLNPTSFGQAMDDIITAIKTQLQKNGFVSK
jgi:hypothetical protein